MKGILATMLALWMTGTVIGQSFQPDNLSPFGSGNPSRPTPDTQQDRNLSGLSSINSQATRGQLKYELLLDADIIRKFRIDGELSSQIPSHIRSDVSEVVFGFPAALRNERTVAPIQPTWRDNGVLFFEFAESDLRNIEVNPLRYQFSTEEIGKIDFIVVRLRSANVASSDRETAITPVNPNPIGANDRFANPTSPTTFREISPPIDNRRDPVANTESRFPDRGQFANPVGSVPDLNRFASSNATSNNDNFEVGNFQSGREPETGLWHNESLRPRRPDLNSGGSQDAAVQNRAEFLTRMADDLNRRESEVAKKEQLMEQQHRAYLAELEKNRLLGAPRGDSSGNWSSGIITDSRSSSALSSTKPGYENETHMQRTLDSIAAAINGVRQDSTLLWNRLDSLENRQSQYSLAQADSSVPQMPSRSDDRLSRNYSPNVNAPPLSNFQTQISGPGAVAKDNVNQQSMTGPLFFMLCCSLGLNVYLGVVARNLYVRYNELADELRETFSASMSS
jgi:hypothetical protein